MKRHLELTDSSLVMIPFWPIHLEPGIKGFISPMLVTVPVRLRMLLTTLMPQNYGGPSLRLFRGCSGETEIPLTAFEQIDVCTLCGSLDYELRPGPDDGVHLRVEHLDIEHVHQSKTGHHFQAWLVGERLPAPEDLGE